MPISMIRDILIVQIIRNARWSTSVWMRVGREVAGGRVATRMFSGFGFRVAWDTSAQFGDRRRPAGAVGRRQGPNHVALP